MTFVFCTSDTENYIHALSILTCILWDFKCMKCFSILCFISTHRSNLNDWCISIFLVDIRSIYNTSIYNITDFQIWRRNFKSNATVHEILRFVWHTRHCQWAFALYYDASVRHVSPNLFFSPWRVDGLAATEARINTREAWILSPFPVRVYVAATWFSPYEVFFLTQRGSILRSANTSPNTKTDIIITLWTLFRQFII